MTFIVIEYDKDKKARRIIFSITEGAAQTVDSTRPSCDANDAASDSAHSSDHPPPITEYDELQVHSETNGDEIRFIVESKVENTPVSYWFRETFHYISKQFKLTEQQVSELNFYKSLDDAFWETEEDLIILNAGRAELLEDNDPQIISSELEVYAKKIAEILPALTTKMDLHKLAIDKFTSDGAVKTQLQNYLRHEFENKKRSIQSGIKIHGIYQNLIAYLQNTSGRGSVKRLEYIIKILVPIQNIKKAQKFFLNENEGFYKYKLNQPGISGIRRISLYGEPPQLFPHHLDDASDAIMEIAFQNGEKKLFQVPSGVLTLKVLNHIFTDLNAHVDLTSALRTKPALGPEYFDGGLSGYNQDTIDHYKKLHSEIQQEIAAFVKFLPTPIELIFLGCGRGDEIKPVIQYLEESQIEYIIFGIDLYADNIEFAKRQPEFQHRPVFFIKKDANHIDDIFHHLRQNCREVRSVYSASTICIASGFLTRMTSKDSVEAFEIFKKVAHYADHIIITGRISNLISRRDAKSAGMTNIQRNFSYDRKLGIIDRFVMKNAGTQAQEIIASLKLQKNHKRINLKDHARPIRVLRQMIYKGFDFKNSKKLEIDLRDAYIEAMKDKTGELEFLITLIKKCKVRIIATGREEWYQKMLEMLGDKFLSNVLYLPSDYVSIRNQDNMLIHERRKISQKMEERVEAIVNCKAKI